MTSVTAHPGGQAPDGVAWRRLDARMLVIGPAGGLLRLLPVVAVLLLTGDVGDPVRLGLAGGAGGAVVLAGVVRWATTRYRITPDRVELHSGWLLRRRRSVPRDRLRSVDLTSRLLHRVFGLSVVQVGAAAGSSTERGFDLDAVSSAEADRLRRELLGHPPGPVQPSATAARADRAPVEELSGDEQEVLARLDWTWLRYAPLTFSSVAGVGALGAFALNVVDDLGIDPRDIDLVDTTAERLASGPLWQGVSLVVAVLAVVAAAGALLLYAERWYGYLLTREADPEETGLPHAGTLRVRRGLLTRRSLSVTERRLRGVEIVEPLLLRLGRGAQSRALATGLARDAQSGALLPPAPRGEAHRVASAALREPTGEVTGAALRRHPAAAGNRRRFRALAGVAPGVAALVWFGAGGGALRWLWVAAVALTIAGVLLGMDRSRNLGSAVTARYLVTRRGSLVRRTVALQREGVVGWTIRQSPWQRRSGLISLEATTAAGTGGYPVVDIGAEDGIALADAAVPGLLTPFRSGL